MKEEFNDSYLKIKEQAIEDSKKIDFSNMNNDDRLKEALKMVREKGLSDVKEQMTYVANLLVPDDKELSDKWNENEKSIKKTAEFYGVPDYVVNVKVLGLNEDEMNLKNDEKDNTEIESNNENKDIEDSNSMEQGENNLEINPIELNEQEETSLLEEPFSKINPVMESVVKENIKDQNVQKKETIKAIADIDLLIKKSDDQASELEALQKKLEELENSNEELIQSNKEKDKTIEEQDSEISKLKKSKNDLEEQIEDKDKVIDSLNNDISSIKKSNKDLEEQNEAKDKTITGLNKNIEELEKTNSDLVDSNEEKDKTISELNKEMENKDITNDSLTRQLALAQAENNVLNEKNASLETYKNDYEKLMNYLNQNLFKDDSKSTRLAA